jgi:hypothetical protein
VLRVEVLNKNEAETCICGKMLEQLCESFETTSGSADSYDRERGCGMVV